MKQKSCPVSTDGHLLPLFVYTGGVMICGDDDVTFGVKRRWAARAAQVSNCA